MSRFAAVALLVLLESVCGDPGHRHVVAILQVGNGGQFGDWHPAQYCPEQTYAVGYYIKVEPQQSGGDDTALNGIILICLRSGGGTVYSGVGPWGLSYSAKFCPDAQVMVQFILKVEPYLGGWEDDTAANDVAFMCDYLANRAGAASFIQAEGGGRWGSWSPNWSNTCPEHSGICGITTKIESPQGLGDDTSLNDVKFFCCDD